jgi:ketosteroid isomerase-like protein
MSEENVEIVRRDVAARSSRDWAVLSEIWHPDIELELVAGSGTFRGLEEIRPFFETLSDLYSDYWVEADEIIDAGERVVTAERVGGRGLKGSVAGHRVEDRFFRVISFKEGRVWRVKEYRTRNEALEAAGVRVSTRPGA